MHLLIVYDICNDRRLRRVARLMERFGNRVQKSVFQCELSDAGLSDLRGGLENLVDPARDSVRIYRVPGRTMEEQQILGVGTPGPAATTVII